MRLFQQHSIRPLSWHITLFVEPMGISGIEFSESFFARWGIICSDIRYQFVKLGTGHDHMIVHFDLSWRHLPESKSKLRLAVLGDRRPRNCQEKVRKGREVRNLDTKPQKLTPQASRRTQLFINLGACLHIIRQRFSGTVHYKEDKLELNTRKCCQHESNCLRKN